MIEHIKPKPDQPTLFEDTADAHGGPLADDASDGVEGPNGLAAGGQNDGGPEPQEAKTGATASYQVAARQFAKDTITSAKRYMNSLSPGEKAIVIVSALAIAVIGIKLEQDKPSPGIAGPEKVVADSGIDYAVDSGNEPSPEPTLLNEAAHYEEDPAITGINGETMSRSTWLNLWKVSSEQMYGGEADSTVNIDMTLNYLKDKIAAAKGQSVKEEIGAGIRYLSNTVYLFRHDKRLLVIENPIIFGIKLPVEGSSESTFSWKANGEEHDIFTIIFPVDEEWHQFTINEKGYAGWSSLPGGRVVGIFHTVAPDARYQAEIGEGVLNPVAPVAGKPSEEPYPSVTTGIDMGGAVATTTVFTDEQEKWSDWTAWVELAKKHPELTPADLDTLNNFS